MLCMPSLWPAVDWMHSCVPPNCAGRIHMVQLKAGSSFFPFSITVLDQVRRGAGWMNGGWGGWGGRLQYLA